MWFISGSQGPRCQLGWAQSYVRSEMNERLKVSPEECSASLYPSSATPPLLSWGSLLPALRKSSKPRARLSAPRPAPALSHFLSGGGPSTGTSPLDSSRDRLLTDATGWKSSPALQEPNRESKLRWAPCSRSLHPPDLLASRRTLSCLTRPPCLPRSPPPEATSPATAQQRY